MGVLAETKCYTYHLNRCAVCRKICRTRLHLPYSSLMCCRSVHGGTTTNIVFSIADISRGFDHFSPADSPVSTCIGGTFRLFCTFQYGLMNILDGTNVPPPSMTCKVIKADFGSSAGFCRFLRVLVFPNWFVFIFFICPALLELHRDVWNNRPNNELIRRLPGDVRKTGRAFCSRHSAATRCYLFPLLPAAH